MICIIRIRGEVNMDRDVAETLSRLRMRRKYACVVINPNKEQEGMIKKVKDLVAFGEISKEKLEKGKKYESLNLKPFFRLHPPRGGIKSKAHFPKGVLGNHRGKINELVLRML